MAKKWNPDNEQPLSKKWTDEQVQLAFRPLFKTLNDSGIQKTNNSLYQVVSQLLKNAERNKDLTVNQFNEIIQTINGISISVTSVSGTVGALASLTYLTATDESTDLPNSRELLAGTNVAFDDTIANQRTVNVVAAAGDYVVVSDGATPTPAPIDDGFGDFIYILYTA